MPSGPTEPAWSGAPGWIGRGAQYTRTTGGSAPGLDVAYPTDVQYHDILILHIVVIEGTVNTPTINAPAGWSTVDAGNIGSIFFQSAIFWKRADGTETGTINVSVSTAGDGFNATMSNIRGCVATGTPYEALGTASGNSAAPTGASVVTTGANRLVCNMISKQSTGSPTSTPAASWSERYDLALGGGQGSAIVLDDLVQATATTVSGEATTGSASSRWRCVSFALLPR